MNLMMLGLNLDTHIISHKYVKNYTKLNIAEGITKLCVLDKEVITQQQQNNTHTTPCKSHDSDPGRLAPLLDELPPDHRVN